MSDVVSRIIKVILADWRGWIVVISGLVTIGIGFGYLINYIIKTRRNKPGVIIKTNVGFYKVKRIGEAIWKKFLRDKDNGNNDGEN